MGVTKPNMTYGIKFWFYVNNFKREPRALYTPTVFALSINFLEWFYSLFKLDGMPAVLQSLIVILPRKVP